ncbi:MAG: hypothetical protein IJE07_13805 [Clostridia bacterium]|nr:hypothetical protein [Clostridia bacterium]
MKRIASFLILSALLCSLLCPAMAWEVSPEHEALAAQHLPGYQLLSASSYSDDAVLLVESPAGETQLAFCTENVVSLTPPLPQNLFWITDARISPDSAMLLVEDYEGAIYFLGCVCTAEGWQVTVSTVLPSGATMLADPEGAILYWERPAGLGSSRIGYEFFVELQEDGRWLVMGTDFHHASATIESYISYHWPFVCTEYHSLHGEQLFSRDVTEVDWLTFPMTLEDVAAQMDLSAWATLGEEAPLLDAPGGVVQARFNPGTHLFILGYEDGWVHVAPGGSAVSGWMAADALFIGSRQLEAKYLSPDICPAVNPYGNDLDVYLLPSQTADSPLLIRLEGTKAQMVDELGVWGDGTWTMIYSNDIPGEVGFVRTEQLEAVPENGVG